MMTAGMSSFTDRACVLGCGRMCGHLTASLSLALIRGYSGANLDRSAQHRRVDRRPSCQREVPE
jgi:hypothetical protein